MVVPWSDIRSRTRQARRSHRKCEVRRVLEPCRRRADGLRAPPRFSIGPIGSASSDEACIPSPSLAFGMYGGDAQTERRPGSPGDPLEIRIPRAPIHRAHPLRRKPETTIWMKAGPDEYGFYSNVNPDVPHRRWEPESRAPSGRVHCGADAAVQRLCRTGGRTLFRNGPEKVFLTMPPTPQPPVPRRSRPSSSCSA